VRSGFRLRLLLSTSVLGLVWLDAGGAVVESLRLWAGPESTRVVLDLSDPTAHRVFTLSDPHRIVIDLTDTRASMPGGYPEGRGFVSGVRTGDRPGGELRVVLDVIQAVKPKSFLLQPNESYGHRLVIDLMSLSTGPVIKRAPGVGTGGGRPVVIAIDPGHGGEDPGASGPHGVREKDVVLQVARRLADQVHAQAGMQPMLVRNGDYFVSLRERTELARRAEADLFVSVHADAFRDDRARGATVYALSSKGATDEAARRLAERENASDLIGGVSLSDKDQLLARVLLDLSQSAAISASTAAGQRVIERLDAVTTLRKPTVQRAPFLVLKSPDIPSLLIETAYISNPGEETALSDGRYQVQLARAIHDGIVDYFRTNPPPGSYLAQHPPPQSRSSMYHVISRGETLSGIADRYDVSLSVLRQLNKLSGDIIRIGQVLTIPAG